MSANADLAEINNNQNEQIDHEHTCGVIFDWFIHAQYSETCL